MATLACPKKSRRSGRSSSIPTWSKRASLALCLSLVDVTIPPQQLDLQLIDWLRHVDRNFLIVATKADRISDNQLRTSLQKLSEQLQVSRGPNYSVLRQSPHRVTKSCGQRSGSGGRSTKKLELGRMSRTW